MMKKLSVLVLVMVMVLGAFGAFAESMPVSRVQKLLEEGKAMEQTVKFTIDEATVKGLIPALSGSELPEEQSVLVTTLINALSKLRVRTLATVTDSNTVVGTDTNDIVRIDVSNDMEKGEATIVTDLLPGYAFMSKTDPALAELIKKLQANPEEIPKLGDKYMAVAAKWFEETLAPTMKTEEGEFVENDLKYNVKMTSDLTPEQAKSLIKAILAEAKNDDMVKDLLNGILGYVAKTSAAAGKDVSDMPATADAALERLEKEMNDDKDSVSSDPITITVLKNKEGKGAAVILSDGEKPVNDDESFYVSFASRPAEAGSALRVLFIQKALSENEKTVNWDEVKTIAMMGGDPSVTSVREELDIAVKDGKLETEAFINIGMKGLPITLTISSSETLEGDYVSDSRIAVGVVLPDPLLVIDIHTVDVDKQPVKADTAGAALINVEDLQKKDGQEEVQQKLSQSLMESLPQLLERMSAALPEEMPVIMQMLDGAMAQQGADADGDTQHATLGN